jgi:integrase
VEGQRKIETIKLESPRSIAGVNRELEVMRAVMRFAKQQKWIITSPFEEGSSLISKADETKRERVLSFDEEKRLLAACQGRRAHLHALIITAIDTAMRRGELFKLQWKEVDFIGRTITITARNSKTAKARIIAMTPRVHQELLQLAAVAPQDGNGLVFGITDTIKKSFTGACAAAQITGLRFHDLRHTAITRMVQAGITPMEVMKISGHTQMVTFARYVNPNHEAICRAADMLAQYHTAQASG